MCARNSCDKGTRNLEAGGWSRLVELHQAPSNKALRSVLRISPGALGDVLAVAMATKQAMSLASRRCKLLAQKHPSKFG